MSILKTQLTIFAISVVLAGLNYWLLGFIVTNPSIVIFYGFTVMYYVYFFLHPYSKEIRNLYEGRPPEPLTEREKKLWKIK
jgi:hypothetical protein